MWIMKGNGRVGELLENITHNFEGLIWRKFTERQQTRVPMKPRTKQNSLAIDLVMVSVESNECNKALYKKVRDIKGSARDQAFRVGAPSLLEKAMPGIQEAW